jgi:hypothetical protein
VLGLRQALLDLVGSGETIAHLRQNGRIVISVPPAPAHPADLRPGRIVRPVK